MTKNKSVNEHDRPEEGKIYSLTGKKGTPSISNGNSWKESEVKNICPACRENKLDETLAMNALSRYAKGKYICSPCGVREAFEGNFWHHEA